MPKIVESIQWESLDGAVLYREVYDDGSRGALVSAEFDIGDPRYRDKVLKIAKERIGRKVE